MLPLADRDAALEAARVLGTASGDTLVFPTEDGAPVLVDYTACARTA